MNTEIKILQKDNIGEFIDLITIFEDVFQMESYERPDQIHLQNLLDRDNFFAIVAKNDSKIVGGLAVYVLDQYYSEKPLAYIYDLAVLTQYQRKGIGKRLIDFNTMYCKKKGFEEVFVQADKIDGYAIDFYRSTLPSNEEEVVHFYYNLADEGKK